MADSDLLLAYGYLTQLGCGRSHGTIVTAGQHEKRCGRYREYCPYFSYVHCLFLL